MQRVWGMTHWKSVIEWRREGRWTLIACRKIVCYVVWTPFCKILWIMFQSSGSPMPSIASPPSSQSQFCPSYSHWPSIRHHLSSWNSSTAHRGDGCEEDFRVLPYALWSLCSCEVGLPNLRLNCCSSWVWSRDKSHVEPASYCGVDQVPGDDLWCKVYWILYTQILALWTTQAE